VSITKSYGRAATVNGVPTPFLYGSGYGKDADLAVLGSAMAELLTDAYALDIEVRGNSSGKDVGAHYDGEFFFSLGARRAENETIVFTSGFEAHVVEAEAIVTNVPNRGGYQLEQRDRDYSAKRGEIVVKVSCYSPDFSTMEEAFAWLKQYGTQFCPSIVDSQSQKAM
jgi:hypothetical protein